MVARLLYPALRYRTSRDDYTRTHSELEDRALGPGWFIDPDCTVPLNPVSPPPPPPAPAPAEDEDAEMKAFLGKPKGRK